MEGSITPVVSLVAGVGIGLQVFVVLLQKVDLGQCSLQALCGWEQTWYLIVERRKVDEVRLEGSITVRYLKVE